MRGDAEEPPCFSYVSPGAWPKDHVVLRSRDARSERLSATSKGCTEGGTASVPPERTCAALLLQYFNG